MRAEQRARFERLNGEAVLTFTPRRYDELDALVHASPRASLMSALVASR